MNNVAFIDTNVMCSVSLCNQQHKSKFHPLKNECFLKVSYINLVLKQKLNVEDGADKASTSHNMILTGVRCVIKRITGNQSASMQSTRKDKLNLRNPFFNCICLWLTTFVILFEIIWEIPVQVKTTSIVPVIKIQL